MTDFTALAELYLQVWNEGDAARRRELAGDLFAATCVFTDPLASVQGPDGIEAVIAQGQQQFAGHHLRLAGPVDGHHDQLRFTWELVSDGNEQAPPVVVGFDVLVTGPDGKIAQVLGFLDRAPAM
ncbi:nuclear transport factor 2 family protein [Kineosporia rhizophila]|uniref:nuclear transport factor 2 family protein n=1 Tax=Kineosporia rhizophila TaxID=84633 RepID=UPI001E5C25A9|nr:nuclear transport factor 2 family protein [Kineosporia rhizophila]MCE0540383.1 nuclear transport factor 2 family protein [Kineosporia rhizophila]